MNRIIVIFAAGIIILAGSCQEPEEFPIEPHISFRELVKYTDAAGKDSLIEFFFNFTDGDGDIGFMKDETGPPYTGEFSNNLIVNLQEKTGGVFSQTYYYTQVDSITPAGDTIPVIKLVPLQFLYRIPYIGTTGSNKGVKGELSVRVSPIGFTKPSRFEFFIYDRALHKSNIELTTEFLIKN
jgi:hypothetical protein